MEGKKYGNVVWGRNGSGILQMDGSPVMDKCKRGVNRQSHKDNISPKTIDWQNKIFVHFCKQKGSNTGVLAVYGIAGYKPLRALQCPCKGSRQVTQG